MGPYLLYHPNDVLIAVLFIRAVAHVIRCALDAKTEPVHTSGLQYVQHVVLDRVDTSIGPDIDLVLTAGQCLSYTVVVPRVGDNLPVDKLDVHNAKVVTEVVMLLHDCPHAPHAIGWTA